MLVDALFSSYIKYRIKRIELYRDYPIECQRGVWLDLLKSGKQTEYGRAIGFERIEGLEDFRSVIPLNDYSTLEPYIIRSINGERNVLWPGTTRWFAKSSGTTGTRIKTLPVTRESLENNHYAGGKDLLACYHHNVPNRKLYSKKHLILGGATAYKPSNITPSLQIFRLLSLTTYRFGPNSGGYQTRTLYCMPTGKKN